MSLSLTETTTVVLDGVAAGRFALDERRASALRPVGEPSSVMPAGDAAELLEAITAWRIDVWVDGG